jgi:hypothetical protein
MDTRAERVRAIADDMLSSSTDLDAEYTLGRIMIVVEDDGGDIFKALDRIKEILSAYTIVRRERG